MLLLLPTMVEGGGCAAMVDAGVMVGVVAAKMAEVEAAPGEKKREKNYHNTRRIIIIRYNLSYYPKLSQNKSKCATATVLCVLQKTITCTLVHLICFL